MKARRKIITAALAGIAIAGVGLLAAFLLYFSPAAEKAFTVKVYFFKEDQLVAVERSLPADKSLLREAIEQLLAGPTAAEKKQGIVSQLADKIKVRGLKIKGGVAIVNFSRELASGSAGAGRLRAMMQQIVYTATAISGVEKVWLWVEGEKEVVLGGEGLVLDQPLGRESLQLF
jgi:spore germination protein GerM